MSGAARGLPGRFAVPIFEGANSYRADPRRTSPEGTGSDQSVRERTAAILERVRREGDDALVELARRFDSAAFESSHLRVSPEELARLAADAGPEERGLLRRTRERIAAYHERQREESFRMDLGEGSRLEWRSAPIASVGVYVPGGAAVYPLHRAHEHRSGRGGRGSADGARDAAGRARTQSGAGGGDPRGRRPRGLPNRRSPGHRGPGLRNGDRLRR